MEKTITVKELVEKYEAAVDKMKPNVLKNIKSKKYINYEDKIAAMDRVIIATHVNTEGTVRLHTPMKFVLFTVSIINMYTNILVDETKVLSEFNELHKVGLIDKLIHPKDGQEVIIPLNEITECAEIMSMLGEDFMTNNYGIRALITKHMSDINKMLPEAFAQFLKTIGEKE